MLKKRIPKILGIALAVIFLIVIIFPFYWQVITSFKDPLDISKMPTEIWPSRFSTYFYESVIVKHNFGRYLWNSVIVAGVTMLLCIVVAMPAAYAFARVHFTAKGFWRTFILVANMFPIIAVVTPLFIQFKKMHLINTYWGLIIPSIVISLPLAIWTLVAFLEKIPIDLEHAAQVDGATRFQSVYKIILPLATPGIFSTAIIAFITTWNEFMFALIFTTKPTMRTVPVAIAMFPGEFTVPWGDMAAASILATLPIVIVVILCQKYIVAGLTAGAVKG